MSEGRILHAISGFYYVETPEGVLECKAKGAFRKEKLTPLVGDLVTVTASRETGKAVVSGIKERKNFCCARRSQILTGCLLSFRQQGPNRIFMCLTS